MTVTSKLPKTLRRIIKSSCMPTLRHYLDDLDVRVGTLESILGDVDDDTIFDDTTLTQADTAIKQRLDVLEAYFTRDLSFTIKDSQDTPEPIQGAVVTINEKTGTTGAAGGCTVSGIMDGTYTVTVTAEGFEDYSGEKSVAADSTSFTINLTAVTPAEET